jgi:glycosyltransferase involved in cell wall biosynthesis
MRVLFVNAGILGMASFSKYIREAMAVDPDIDASHINLSEDLTVGERIVRRAMCARLWRDEWLGLRNVDLARLRQEYHAGLLAARRMRMIDAASFDVIHFHRQTTAYASVGLMQRVPSIVSIDATQDVMLDAAETAFERWSYAPNAAIDGRIFRHAAAIISTSEWTADRLHRRYPDCTTPVHVMPPPVRTQFFNERWIAERFRRASAPAYRPRVLFVGGDFRRKGGDDLVEAWRADELYRLADLDLVSDWPSIDPGLPGVRVIRGVASYSSEWSDLWRVADIFVLPTRHEAFGTVFQEAGAAGLPRIGTRIMAVPETIVDGRSGLLVDPHDRRALTQALRQLIESPDLRRELGCAGRERVLQRASAERYSYKLREVIRSLAPQQVVAR